MEAGGVPLAPRGSAWEVLAVATRLGLTSFGGPVAHLGYFRDEYVVRRRWLDDHAYADLVALSQLLPGPASSQVGIAVGLLRAGTAGALAAWLGFTLPSAVLLVAFAAGVGGVGPGAGWLHGLELAAVAVVALAVAGMARTLTPDPPRVVLAGGAAAVALVWGGVPGQLLPIAAGAALGAAVLHALPAPPPLRLEVPVSRRSAAACLALFATLLVALPLLAGLGRPAALADAFYRTGALVFGGGHVVLPLLQAEVVPPGWVSETEFVAGYGAAQAVPGPLVTFAAYLGTVADGLWAGALALGAIFLPSFLLVFAALPLWRAVRSSRRLRAALAGVGAAVVGLVAAALWDPVATTAIEGVRDAGAALALLGLLLLRVPPWAVVAVAAGGAAVL